jgi:hypothetical protein
MEAAISEDGRWLAFDAGPIILYDLHSGESIQVGEELILATTELSMSNDGRYLAFRALLSGRSGKPEGMTDIFLFDQHSQETAKISVAWDGGEANGASGVPGVSPDGRFVAFWSGAENLAASDDKCYTGIYVFDVTEKTITGLTIAAPQTPQQFARLKGHVMSIDYAQRTAVIRGQIDYVGCQYRPKDITMTAPSGTNIARFEKRSDQDTVSGSVSFDDLRVGSYLTVLGHEDSARPSQTIVAFQIGEEYVDGVPGPT